MNQRRYIVDRSISHRPMHRNTAQIFPSLQRAKNKYYIEEGFDQVLDGDREMRTSSNVIRKTNLNQSRLDKPSSRMVEPICGRNSESSTTPFIRSCSRKTHAQTLQHHVRIGKTSRPIRFFIFCRFAFSSFPVVHSTLNASMIQSSFNLIIIVINIICRLVNLANCCGQWIVAKNHQCTKISTWLVI